MIALSDGAELLSKRMHPEMEWRRIAFVPALSIEPNGFVPGLRGQYPRQKRRPVTAIDLLDDPQNDAIGLDAHPSTPNASRRDGRAGLPAPKDVLPQTRQCALVAYSCNTEPLLQNRREALDRDPLLLPGPILRSLAGTPGNDRIRAVPASASPASSRLRIPRRAERPLESSDHIAQRPAARKGILPFLRLASASVPHGKPGKPSARRSRRGLSRRVASRINENSHFRMNSGDRHTPCPRSSSPERNEAATGRARDCRGERDPPAESNAFAHLPRPSPPKDGSGRALTLDEDFPNRSTIMLGFA